MMPMRSARKIASPMSWVMKRTVLAVRLPDARQLVLQDGARLRVERGERLVHEQDWDSQTSARAIWMRCFMPPESWLGYLCLLALRARRVEVAAAARGARSRRGTPASRSPNSTFSLRGQPAVERIVALEDRPTRSTPGR